MLDHVPFKEVSAEYLRHVARHNGLKVSSDTPKSKVVDILNQKLNEGQQLRMPNQQSNPPASTTQSQNNLPPPPDPLGANGIPANVPPLTQTAKTPLWQHILNIATLVALFLTFAQTFVITLTYRTELDKLTRTEEEQRLRDWQRVVVHRILQKGFNEGKTKLGLTFDEIKSKYITEAATIKTIDLKKDSLQDDVLEKILIDLMKDDLVFYTKEHGYTVMMSAANPRYDRSIVEERGKFVILNLLQSEPGRYDVATLGGVVQEKCGMAHDEYIVLLTTLSASNMVFLEKTNKLFSALNTTRVQPPAVAVSP